MESLCPFPSLPSPAALRRSAPLLAWPRLPCQARPCQTPPRRALPAEPRLAAPNRALPRHACHPRPALRTQTATSNEARAGCRPVATRRRNLCRAGRTIQRPACAKGTHRSDTMLHPDPPGENRFNFGKGGPHVRTTRGVRPAPGGANSAGRPARPCTARVRVPVPDLVPPSDSAPPSTSGRPRSRSRHRPVPSCRARCRRWPP